MGISLPGGRIEAHHAVEAEALRRRPDKGAFAAIPVAGEDDDLRLLDQQAPVAVEVRLDVHASPVQLAILRGKRRGPHRHDRGNRHREAQRQAGGHSNTHHAKRD
ncbi:MAG: hypothetical protein IPG88_18420 [Gemmatimonadetes bacterium]|nr:hypothetical protein [Gemmatimonadota bacterium]